MLQWTTVAENADTVGGGEPPSGRSRSGDDPHDPCWIWWCLLALAHLQLLLPGNKVVLQINQTYYTFFLCVLEDDNKESDVSIA